MGLLYGTLPLPPFFRKIDLLTIDNRTGSALGTPLAWPEAKKRAGQVREWGIEVLPSVLFASASLRRAGRKTLSLDGAALV